MIHVLPPQLRWYSLDFWLLIDVGALRSIGYSTSWMLNFFGAHTTSGCSGRMVLSTVLARKLPSKISIDGALFGVGSSSTTVLSSVPVTWCPLQR